jgi:hypothetical protein
MGLARRSLESTSRVQEHKVGFNFKKDKQHRIKLKKKGEHHELQEHLK